MFRFAKEVICLEETQVRLALTTDFIILPEVLFQQTVKAFLNMNP